MLEFAICDDNPAELHTVKTFVLAYFSKHPEWVANITAFQSPLVLVSRIEAGYRPDLCLFDIFMPDIDGIRVGRALRTAGGTGLLLYLTSSTSHALDAFGVHAFRYLLKPLEAAPLNDALDDALLLLNSINARVLPVRTGDTLVPLKFSDICYVECIRHVHVFHMVGGGVLESNNSRSAFLTDMAPLLEDSRFLSPHRSFVLNLTQLSRLSNAGALMTSGFLVPVTRTRYAKVKQQYLAFLSGQNTDSWRDGP